MHFNHELGALLLGGWLLMAPPVNQHGEPDPQAPLNKWDQHAAFDTAAECQHDLDSLQDSVTNNPKNKQAFKDYVLFERCVPADSVYPPQAPKK